MLLKIKAWSKMKMRMVSRMKTKKKTMTKMMRTWTMMKSFLATQLT